MGQAAIVQHGVVLGVEALEGTDALIRRCAHLQDDGHGSILVKLSKPSQERRVDLPTIGLDTIREAIAAGMVGIAVEAGATLLLGREQLAAEADASNLFLHGIDASNLPT